MRVGQKADAGGVSADVRKGSHSDPGAQHKSPGNTGPFGRELKAKSPTGKLWGAHREVVHPHGLVAVEATA